MGDRTIIALILKEKLEVGKIFKVLHNESNKCSVSKYISDGNCD